jgi:peptidoglycan/LPS O-acetylase OafA/YrhL
MNIAAGVNKSSYVPAIDGLRAVAVLAVITFHLRASYLPGGFNGVDIFYVISRFVVTKSIVGKSYPTFPNFLSLFYARRLQRIMPALIIALLFAFTMSALFIPEAWISGNTRSTGIAAFFGLSNVVLALNNDSYFSPASSLNPFTHTWSLGVEEQFI